MFRTICFRRQHRLAGYNFDTGLLAEALLFYNKVYLVCDVGMLTQLLTTIDFDLLIELVEEHNLTIVYLENDIAVINNHKDGVELHDVATIKARDFTVDRITEKILVQRTGHSGKSRRMVKRLMPLIETRAYENSVLADTRSDYTNTYFTRNAAKIALETLIPGIELPGDIVFDVKQAEKGLIVETNLNFSRINTAFNRIVPATVASMNPAMLLHYIQSARADLYISLLYEAELATDNIHALLYEFRLNSIYNTRLKSEEELRLFQNLILDNGHAIREAINSGERSIRDLIKLLERAKRFRAWIQDQPPNAELAKAYISEIMGDSWINRLPTKTLRWLLFTGAGIGLDLLGAGGLGTAAGVALSAGDTFLLDKLMKGWQPNQFVQAHLVKFGKKA